MKKFDKRKIASVLGVLGETLKDNEEVLTDDKSGIDFKRFNEHHVTKKAVEELKALGVYDVKKLRALGFVVGGMLLRF